MMDVVLQQFYMGAGTHNTDAQWSEPMFGGAVVANFKAFDPNVTLVVNRQYAASAIREQDALRRGRPSRRDSFEK